MNQLTVYSRPGCHLCDEMLFVLRALQPYYSFELMVENVDSCEKWLAAHGNRVPVLEATNSISTTELCWGRIDDHKVTTWLQANKTD